MSSKLKPIRILLTNDDGVGAIGLLGAYRQLSRVGEVFVVAPDRERSAIGHGITVHKPLRALELDPETSGIQGWSVTGTPADCVKIGLESLLPAPPTIIVSGINAGSNLGTDILYSGTVSAAMEGVIEGYPAMALSLDCQEGETECQYDLAAQIGAALAQYLAETISRVTLLNVNVPDLPREQIRGLKITTLGQRRYRDTIERRVDPRGKAYFWLAGQVVDNLDEEESDVFAVRNGFVSVTPIHLNLTDATMSNHLKKLGLEAIMNSIWESEGDSSRECVADQPK